MDSLNVNDLYDVPATRLLAAQSMLRRTVYGLGDVVSAHLDDDGKVYYLNNALPNRRHYSLATAFNEAGSFELTQFQAITAGTSMQRGGRPLVGSTMGGVAGILDNISNNLAGISDPNVISGLRSVGLDIEDFRGGNLSMDVLTMHSGAAGTKRVANKISQMRRDGSLSGITIMDDEGARVLQFRIGDRILNSYQANYLLSVTGNSILDTETFRGTLESGNPASLVKNLMKIPKRFRSIISEREVSISGNELARFIGGGANNLHQSMLITDPQYDILRKFAFGDPGTKDIYSGSTDRAKAGLKSYYEDLDPLRYIQASQNQFGIDESQIRTLRGAIRNFNPSSPAGNGGFLSDELKEYLNAYFSGDQNMRDFIDDVYGRIEYSYDGSDLLNRDRLRAYKSSIDGEIRRISSQDELSPSVENRRNLRQLRKLSRQIQMGLDEGDQITGRGNIAGVGNIKTAFDVVSLKKDLEGFSGVISKFGLKGEMGFAGDADSLLLSGFGISGDLVYADPTLVAFQPEVFADQSTLAAIDQNTTRVMEEYKAAVESGVLPDKLKRMLENQASGEITDLAPEARSSALRNRQFAQAVLDMYNSGVNPRHAPQLLNMLTSLFASQAYRERKGFLQAVMPDTYRFAIDSESILHGQAGGMRPILGEGYERIGNMINSSGQVVDIDKNLIQFRAKGHKMYFAEGVIGDIRHALGGFDLDDKGLPKLTTFKTQSYDSQGNPRNMRRLAFNITRQPPGGEEILYARASMDADTIRALFSNNTSFNETLENLYDQVGRLQPHFQELTPEQRAYRRKFGDLRRILSGGETGVLSEEMVQGVEDAILAVYRDIYGGNVPELSDRQIGQIKKSGTGPLVVERMGDEPSLSTRGVFRIFEEEGAFDMSDDIQAFLDDASMPGGVKNKIRRIIGSASSFEEVMMALGREYADPAVEAFMNEVYQRRLLSSASEGGDMLGVYINRSMVIGSTYNQYEDLLNSLIASGNQAAAQYMLDNMQVGVLSQESAIDSAVNFSGSRQIAAAITQNMANSGSAEGVTKAIERLNNAAEGNIRLGVLGEDIVSEVGRRIGFAQALDVQDDLRLGIDRLLYDTRIKGGDRFSLVKGILAGAKEAQDLGLGDAEALDNFIKGARRVSEANVEEEITNFLVTNRLFLDATSQYATLSRVDQARAKGMFDALKGSFRSRISRDPAFASVSISKESEAVAQTIVEKYSSRMDELNRLSQAADSMGELQLAESAAFADRLGMDILSDIERGTQVDRVSMHDLVVALERQFEGKRFSLETLRFLSDGIEIIQHEELFQRIMETKRYARAMHFRRMDQLAGGQDEFFVAQIREMLDRPEYSSISDILDPSINRGLNQDNFLQFELDILRSMTGQDLEGTYDEIAESEVRRRAQVAQELMYLEDVDQETLDAIQEVGTISDPPADDKQMKEIVNSVSDYMSDERDADKATYKSIKQYIQNRDYKQLLDDNLIRKSGLALGALVAGSVVYRAVSDRSPDDAQGPPLLPGGSAYEGMPARVPEIGSFGSSGYDSGLSYNVSINGSQEDVERFNQAMGGMTNSNINTTMYNRIPDLSGPPIFDLMGYL